ncbi:MAG: DNA polymerase III subunit beta [Sedimentisphaerales bacterium]|nr:DNA polymerase III subunit beta [Sedimentisphaerales bacterium]
MKVKLNRAAFQEALNLVTSIIPARTPKDILRCLRITAQEDAVRLCATDLEVGISYRVSQVEVETTGDIVVPADKIASIIRESIDEVIVMEAIEATVHIKGADSHFTIYGHDPEQFPNVPDFEGDAVLEMTLGKLQISIEHCLFSAARESTRYALNGVLWEVNGKKLTLVATDGRRLAKAVATLQSAGGVLPEGRVIVPAKTMGLLDRIGGEESSLVAIRFVDNQIILACDSVVVSSNLVEGNFPKYEDIIPKDYDKKLSLNTDAALSAVRRAALLATEDSKGVRISLGEGTMVFTSRAPETGDAQIDMAVDYKGAPIDIGFNPQFLSDVLRVIKTETFELHLGEPDRPGMIKSGKDFLYIIMPVNL